MADLSVVEAESSGAHPIDNMTVAQRLDQVYRRIANAGGDAARIRVVAVTKGFPAEVAREAVEAGLRDLGENYAQELVSKSVELQGVRWHFLGSIQRNKLARLAPIVSVWQTVDREGVADALARLRPGVEILIEVNITSQSGRPGCRPEDVEALVAHCRALPLSVIGLMAVGPQDDPPMCREGFRWLACEAKRLSLPELSMGMTDDFEIAVQEGATILRLGRALFGVRPQR